MNNNKEIYDFVMSKMCEQNAQSVSGAGICMYRGPEGKKCAVGHLIDDEAYIKNLEGKTICDVNINQAVRQSCERRGFVVDESTIILLSIMQEVHDTFSELTNQSFDSYFKENVPYKLKLNNIEVPV